MRHVVRSVFTAALLLLPLVGAAQGVSAAGIRGAVSIDGRQPVDARVRVTHEATGSSIEVRAAGGRFLIQGLEPGGPYTVTARALGFAPQRSDGVFLALGELRPIDFILHPIGTRLDTVNVVAEGRPRSNGGTGTTITESLLHHLPTLNRDVFDFVRLVPQISTKISLPNPGLSAGGMGFRFNNFLINGVSERTLSGSVASAFAGTKSIPLDAVREYQVMLAPYDVRYGDFAGALVNAVTKSGTNTLEGTVFAYGRTDELGRRLLSDASPPYERVQYGFSLGGPIVRDRLHFLLASELQHFTYPADGPFVGQPANADRPVPISAADLDRFGAIMTGHGLQVGSAGPIEIGNPLRNFFARLDLSLPAWNSRLILWNNVGDSDDIAFSRAARDTFSLSSYGITRGGSARTTAAHLHTALDQGGGRHNELLVSHRSQSSNPVGAVQQPVVRVSVPSLSGGRVTLNAGTHETAQGNTTQASMLSIKDNFTLPLGASHVATVGAEVERFNLLRSGANGAFGAWSFASLDDLALGNPDRYEVTLDVGSATSLLTGMQYAAYAGDQWQATDRFSVTGGLRGDLLAIDGAAPYHPVIDSLFGRRTDLMPRRRIELSPRVGFLWDVSGSRRQLLRGGIGVFTGRYPLAWAQSALLSYGAGTSVLRCNFLSTPDRYPPPFNPDYRTRPTSCGGGYSLTPSSRGDVDLLDRDLRMMRVVRGSLAYERRLGNLALTNEALFTRGLSDFVFVNLNLPAPVASDPYGRVMYGTLSSTGTLPRASDSAFSEVIELRNTSRNHSYQLSTRLEMTRRSGMSGFVSYTYSRTRDVQTPTRVNTRGTVTWASARATGSSHSDQSTGVSGNDLPHRVILAGTFRTSWHAPLELSFYYVGESGRPFTYLAFGTSGRGDLNADGSNANDPIYVPRNALDTAEILISGLSDAAGADNSTAAQADRAGLQRRALETFVGKTSCLRRQRGLVMQRNSCYEPWSNTTNASLRQAIPLGNRLIEVQFDVFNVLNLLNAGWGLRREAAPALLEHVGQSGGAAADSRPIFRFDYAAPAWTTRSAESAFQLQLAVRYRF